MKFLIVGLLRNCQKNIYETINCLDKAFLFAEKKEYFLVESDSEDETIKSLKEIKSKRNDLNYISLGNLYSSMPNRIQRIAYCRNKYIEYLWDRKNEWVDYLVVVDMDGVCTKLTSNSVKSCWNKKGWAVCTANQSDYYYDIYALRHSSWSPNDFILSDNKNRKLGFNDQHLILNLYSKMIHLSNKLDFIKVESAFGGLAIYKKKFIPFSARYGHLNEKNKTICEHVIFHNFITGNGGEIFINPSLIIGKMPNDYYSGINYLKFTTFTIILLKKINLLINKIKIFFYIKKLFLKIFRTISY